MGRKVAFVIDKFDPERGGAEGYARDLCRGLADRGFNVHVLARAGRTDDGRIDIHIIPTAKYPKFLRLYTFVRGVEREIKRGGYDIVHGIGHNTGVNVLNPHSGVEQSWIEGDDNSRESGIGRLFAGIKRLLSPRHHLILYLQRRQYRDRGVKAIIAIAEMVKRDIIEYHNVDENKIEVVYNGVDTKRFSTKKRGLYRKKERKRLGIGEDEILILLVSNNFRLKGILPAVELLPVLRERTGGGRGKFRLMIVGRDNPRRYVRAARRLGVEDLVRFVDYVPDPVPLYAAADIYFHPTFYDSCSLTVIEALASGLPVVTTEKNGAAGLIESRETGWVIGDPRDKEEVAQALLYYLDDGVRKRAHRAAELFGERLSLETNIDRVVQIYDRVISLSE